MVNQGTSLIVKGWRVVDRLHTISYQTFTSEHYQASGQGLCQSIEIIQGVEGWEPSGIWMSLFGLKIKTSFTHGVYLESGIGSF